ncbi:ComF family protein [uncultured Chitinophaga sp.]|jgi:Predicted amidophosphoribosyltransferases|uniref:ComF family protein n=1 Tax=uncultured Chitinophaga sp. TaxID=339340 RepID=UPI0026049E84|nr:ComF family protein [uncultured Chitinophaga sp.]
MTMIRNLFVSLVHLFYPHVCDNCGEGLTAAEDVLCLRCQHRLPLTGFHLYADNALEKVFWGRTKVHHAMAAYYYNQGAMVRRLVHQFKYHRRRDIALHLGRQMGLMLQQSTWLNEIDCIVPVPLHKTRVRRRGYNQSALLAAGLAEIIHRPVLPHALKRLSYTDSQTRKNRVSRWENVSGVFTAAATADLRGRHVLLIDDVITTGATTEACCLALREAGAIVSVCALAFTR